MLQAVTLQLQGKVPFLVPAMQCGIHFVRAEEGKLGGDHVQNSLMENFRPIISVPEKTGFTFMGLQSL